MTVCCIGWYRMLVMPKPPKMTWHKCAAGPQIGRCSLMQTYARCWSSPRSSPALKFDYTIGGKWLQHVTHHPYLGMELTDDLNWEHNINQMVSKSQRTLNLLRRNLYECSQNTKELAYETLVRPSLVYASYVWDPFQTNHIHCLEAV